MIKKSTERRGVYPGSFDPITLGHLDIVFQSAKALDWLCVVVGVNPSKKPLFTGDERVGMIRQDIASTVLPRLKAEGYKCKIEVATHGGLTAAFMKAHNAPFYVRGLRLGTEFDQEYPVIMAGVQEYREFTPVFFCTTNPELQHVSSTIARETERFGGTSVHKYLTQATADKLKARIAEEKTQPKP